jgi:hypothetical protein
VTNFIPGPWRVGDNLDVWQEGGGVVAECFWVSGAISVESADANARLIAAAPDLYEVAARWAAWLRAVPPQHRPPGLVEDLDSALAKADGQS